MQAKYPCVCTRHMPTTTTTTSSINLIIKQHLANSSKSYLHINCTYFFIRPTALRMRNKNWIFHMKISNIHVSIYRLPDALIARPVGLSVCSSAWSVIINGFTMTMCFNNKSISFIFIIPPTPCHYELCPLGQRWPADTLSSISVRVSIALRPSMPYEYAYLFMLKHTHAHTHSHQHLCVGNTS